MNNSVIQYGPKANTKEIEKILGYVSKSEVIHKDDMVEV